MIVGSIKEDLALEKKGFNYSRNSEKYFGFGIKSMY